MQSVYSNVSIKILSQKKSTIENATLYEIQIGTPYNRWFLAKKYEQVQQLHDNLAQYYHSLPEFPQDTIFDALFSHFTSQKSTMKQRLQQYLQKLMIRKDVLASDYMIQFLQMNRNSPQLIAASPMLLGQFNIDKDGDYPTKGIRDFYYDPQHKVFIILTADMNAISRMNSFLINTKLPWEDDDFPTLLQVGSVQCWKLFEGNYNYKRLWSKIYPSQAIVIQYSKSKQRLYVGLDNGQIDQLRVSSNEGYSKIAAVKNLQVHEQRVTGLHLDSLAGVMYSIGEDGILNSVQMTNIYKISSIPHDIPLSCIIADHTNKRIFIGADQGHIFVYDISTKGYPRRLITIITPEQSFIKSLGLDLVRNYLFSTGFENGLIAIFDLDKPGRQKYAKQIAMLQGKKNPRRIIWVPQRMQIIVGMEDGTVCFWDSLSGQPIYLFGAHHDQISKMYYDNNKRLLITASKGQQMKFWQIPKFWRDTKIVQMQEDKIEQRRKVDNALKIKQKVRKIAQDSDQDDLLLWYMDSQQQEESSEQFFQF